MCVHFQQIANQIDRFKRSHAKVIQCLQHQVSEIMTGKFAIAAKTVFKHRGGDARFRYQLVEAVAHIAPGNTAF